MPEICRFHGIIIRMFYDEHEQAHFHAAYQGKVAQIGIDPLTIMHGRLHRRAIGLIMEWAVAHQRELLENWERVRSKKPPRKIEPLE